jgi:hypothetical protein
MLPIFIRTGGSNLTSECSWFLSKVINPENTPNIDLKGQP